ncbi:MAG: hypothetical protein AAGM16_12795 [Pseudomonadota bacterium]
MKKTLAILIGAIAIGVATCILTSAYTTANLNLCYSQVFSELASEASLSGEQIDPMFEALPLRGYESDCEQILQTAQQYRNAKGR